MAKYIILGVIQGLTEFFPVSSSAHLVILQKAFGMSGQELVTSVVLHLGTCLALGIFFFKDILLALRDKKTLLFIVVVTIITGIIGISGKDFFESLFSSSKPAAAALFVTGTILILTKKFMHAKRRNADIKDALILGVTQGIAIIPGISRSGITIATLLFRKIDIETSFRLSFLASIPAVLGAAILEGRRIDIVDNFVLKNLAIGFVFSLISGLFSLWMLRKILVKAKLYYFGYYCIFAAIITILFLG